MKKFILTIVILFLCSVASATDYYSPTGNRHPEHRGPVVDGVRQNLGVRPRYMPEPPTIYIPIMPYYHRWTPDMYFRTYPIPVRPFEYTSPYDNWHYYQYIHGDGIFGMRRLG